MPIEGVLSITGRGTVATEQIKQDSSRPGEKVEILGLKAAASTVVTRVKKFNRILDGGPAGDNVGCLLRGTKRTRSSADR